MKHSTRLRVTFDGRTVGELGADQRGQIYFQYDTEWLKTGFDLSPGTMPFNYAVQLSPEPHEFNGLHGVFNDSLPDGWGLLLMDRALQHFAGWQRNEITPLDRLAYIGTRAMGALSYEPAIPLSSDTDVVDIALLAKSANDLLEGEIPEVLNQLQIQGGSPGGARPKVTVALSENNKKCLSGFSELPAGFTHWLVKFRSKEDPQDMGCIEMAYADMARIAGLDMPECKLLQVKNSEHIDEYFAVQRFDRDGATRIHLLSLAGYVYADYRLPSIGYDTVIKATRQITGSIAEAEKAYRLMVFNVLTHNKDDHAKNFAFLRRPEGWMLSPAYDLTFSTGINNQHTTDIAGSGNPDLSDFGRLAQDCGIRRWQEIVEQVNTATAQWSVIAKHRCVSVANTKRIATEFEKIAQRIR